MIIINTIIIIIIIIIDIINHDLMVSNKKHTCFKQKNALPSGYLT